MIREAEPRALLATLADSLDRRWEALALTAAGPGAGCTPTQWRRNADASSRPAFA